MYLRRLLVDGNQPPRFVDERLHGDQLHLLRAGLREIDQALADLLDALRHAQYPGQAVERRRFLGGLGKLLDRPLQYRERRIQLVRHAGADETEVHQAVLGLQPAQRILQVLFMFAKLQDGLVAGTHDLADFVSGDLAVGDQLVLAVVVLRGFVGVEHELQRPVHVQRHDGSFEQQHGENVDDSQDDDQVRLRSRGDLVAQGKVDGDGQDHEEHVVQNHQLGPDLEVAEEPPQPARAHLGGLGERLDAVVTERPLP